MNKQITLFKGYKLKGEARIRLIDNRDIEMCRKAHPDWPEDEIRLLELRYAVDDTGWSSNVITDMCRRFLTNENDLGSSIRMFIHKSTNPSNVLCDFLQNVYTSQVPPQIAIPDTSVFNASTLIQTRTKRFTAPSVARNINIVGLSGSLNISQGGIPSILAFTKLSSTITQSTSQAADVQYRITFSLDG